MSGGRGGRDGHKNGAHCCCACMCILHIPVYGYGTHDKIIIKKYCLIIKYLGLYYFLKLYSKFWILSSFKKVMTFCFALLLQYFVLCFRHIHIQNLHVTISFDIFCSPKLLLREHKQKGFLFRKFFKS